MQCDICGKLEATVHLTEIINDRMTKLHLCEDCAKKKGAEMEEHFGLANLLAGLADLGQAVGASKDVRTKCSSCGLAYPDFKKSGKLGCGGCYETFKTYLVPLFKRIHGSDTHVGKMSHKKGRMRKLKKSDIDELKRRLKKAVELEEFEEAAQLRDEIKKYERK